MNTKNVGRVLLVLSCAAYASIAQAVTYSFDGYIVSATSGSPPQFYPQFTPDTHFTATLVIKDGFAPTDGDPNPARGFYGASCSQSGCPVTYQIKLDDGRTYSAYVATGVTMIVENTPAGDRIQFSSEVSPSGDGYLSVTFNDPSGSALNSDAWPASFNPQLWETITFHLQSTSSSSASTFDAVTGRPVPVREVEARENDFVLRFDTTVQQTYRGEFAVNPNPYTTEWAQFVNNIPGTGARYELVMTNYLSQGTAFVRITRYLHPPPAP